MGRTYPEPFVPTTFSCRITKTTTTVTAVDRRTGQRRRKSADRWDVSGRSNGIEYSKRFARAGLAESWKEQLERGYATGLPFDLRAKRFVTPQFGDARDAPTVFSLTEQFYWANPEWEPKTKMIAATAFNRARLWLLAEGVLLRGADRAAVLDYLEHASFMRTTDGDGLSKQQRVGLGWLKQNSAPAASVPTGQIEEFVARFERSQRRPGEKVSASTIVRYTQPLRACWTWAVARDDIPVSHNPWLGVKSRRKVKGKTPPAVGQTRLAVDKDMVLDVAQAIALAERCGEVGSWGDVVTCYVLVMALSGLRPNEAVGLLWEDLELPDDGSPGWLTVRRTRRRVATRWLDRDEDPEWGPLKDRSIADTRRAPVPPLLVNRLHIHRACFGEGPGGLVFHRHGRPFDLSLFARQVWEPARADMFPARMDLPPDDPRQPKLSRLRRHDLRHAACSWWLRAGVDATVCQRWSGHKNLSVFLDVYQGVAPGREDDGVRKLVSSPAELDVSAGPSLVT